MSIVLDAQLHCIARHLVRHDNRLDVDKEIRHINDQYNLVPESSYSSFEKEVKAIYQFEKAREIKSVDLLGFAKFKVDAMSGSLDPVEFAPEKGGLTA